MQVYKYKTNNVPETSCLYLREIKILETLDIE